ncbi:MAG: DUF192 domain-containing protein [Kiloniellales bacterium]
MTRALILLLVTLLPLSALAVEFEQGELSIVTRSGDTHVIAVELAETQEQRAQGLMFREELAPMSGMLFIYPRNQVPQMWMRNTLIPLDMLFLDERGQVLATANNAVPHSEAIISPGIPARAVLELPGDALERLGVQPGDRILHPRLGGPAQ